MVGSHLGVPTVFSPSTAVGEVDWGVGGGAAILNFPATVQQIARPFHTNAATTRPHEHLSRGWGFAVAGHAREKVDAPLALCHDHSHKQRGRWEGAE